MINITQCSSGEFGCPYFRVYKHPELGDMPVCLLLNEDVDRIWRETLVCPLDVIVGLMRWIGVCFKRFDLGWGFTIKEVFLIKKKVDKWGGAFLVAQANVLTAEFMCSFNSHDCFLELDDLLASDLSIKRKHNRLTITGRKK